MSNSGCPDKSCQMESMKWPKNVLNNMAQNVHFWSPYDVVTLDRLELHRPRSRCQIMIGLHGDFLVGIIFIKQRLSMVLALIILKKCVLAAIKAQKGIGKQLSLPARNRGRCTGVKGKTNQSSKNMYNKIPPVFLQTIKHAMNMFWTYINFPREGKRGRSSRHEGNV